MIPLIALCGYTGVGKDEVAKYLVHRHGFFRVAFADAMREDLLKLNPKVDWVDDLHLREIVGHHGWDYAKRHYPEVRRLLQVYGTEVGRQGFGDNIWIDRAMAKIKANIRVVITDLRFPNEARALKDLGASIVHVVRPNYGKINDHASEMMDYSKICNFTIDNCGTIEDLHSKIEETILA